MPYAEVNGVRLFYTDDPGPDPALLLVHGWTCDSLDWSWQLDAFAAEHRVVAVDLRGHGRSSNGGGYELPSYAADLSALLDALGTGPVVAIGHSLGGAIVTTLAVEHPSRVRALVAIDPAVGLGSALGDVARTVNDQMSGPGANEFLVATWRQMEGPAAAAGLAAWHRRRALALPWEFLAETWRCQEESGLLYRPAADEYLARRAAPVLALYCDAERAEWEATTFRHPYSRAVSWPGCGHWLHQERPLEFNRFVLEWIAALPAM